MPNINSRKNYIFNVIDMRIFCISTFVAVFSVLPSHAFASCSSTLSNTSQSSTTEILANADGQCLTNSGTITITTPDTYALWSYAAANVSMTNSGAIILQGARSAAFEIAGTGSGGPSNTALSLINTGSISSSSGAYDVYAIWPYNGAGTITSIINSGQIVLANTGQSVGIFNYSSNTITTLTNSGNISISGQYAAIGNNSTITTLNNSGSIVSSGNAQGITNNSGSTIGTINNTGTISVPTSGYYGILNNSGATIGTLNNAQGSASVAGILTYSGVLPTYYNIIVNSSSSYGQLSATSVTGSTTFGINSGTITSKLYSGVLQGLTTSNVGATRSGTYSGLNWTLALQNGSSTIWDLIFTGGSTVDTQSSLHSLASKLRGIFSSQVVATNFANMNTYDCNLFDYRGLCISVGGQKTYVDNPSFNMTSAVVVAGYKVSPTLRIGGFLNQNINSNTGASIDISNKSPLMGLFAVWNKNENHLGYQLKIANAYQDKDVTTIREVIVTSEAGRGNTELNTQSYVGELSYAFLANEDKTLVRPYAAVRYTRIKQDGYTEQTSSTVTAPLTYAALADRSTAALVGIKLNHKLADKVNLTGSLGVEQDLNHDVDNLTASGVSGLTSEAFNNNINRTRPVASIGAYYMPVKNQRIAADIYYQELPFQSTAATTAYVNYMIGF